MRKWSADEAPRRAAALAFYTFLALAPLLVVMVSILGLVYGRSGAQAHIIEQARSAVGPTAASALKTVIEHASSRESGIIGVIVGGVLLVLGASGAFSELQTDLNVIWDVNEPRRGILKKVIGRLFTFVALLGVGLLLVVSLLASALVSILALRLGNSPSEPSVILQIGDFLAFLGIVTLLMAFLFKVLPHAKIRWKDVWVGALVTGFLFSIGKLAIGLYLGKSSTSSSYGAAGAFVVLLIWIYYSAQILFFGAEFTALYATRYGEHVRPLERAPEPEAGPNGRPGS